MNITISTLGKFNLFYLAQELDRRGKLHRLLTDFYSGKRPWLRFFRHDREIISAERCKILPAMEIFRALRHLPKGELARQLEVVQADAFDAWAARHLEASDVVLARSIVAERTLRRARAMGAFTAVFRGSAHIQTQYEILAEEHRRFGLPLFVNPRLRDKELREYETADAVCTPSSFAMQSFVERGIGSDRIIVSPPGADGRVFFPEQRPRAHRVVFAGGVSLEKGVPYLLRATSRLGLKKAEVLLVGAVDGPMEAFLRRSGFRFTHHPPCGQDRLRDLYQSSEVLVLPSVQDGFGMVMLEAMACGTPVVATTHTGGPDIIENGKNGFLVPPRDPDALANRIERILADGNRRSRMSRAAIRTAARFTWGRSAEVFLSECERRLSLRGTPSTTIRGRGASKARASDRAGATRVRE